MAANNEETDWHCLLNEKNERTALAKLKRFSSDFLLNWRSDDGDTAVHQLARRGWAKLLARLLGDHPALRSVVAAPSRCGGLSALHLACSAGDAAVCRVLLDAGASLLTSHSIVNQRPGELLPGASGRRVRAWQAAELAAFRLRDQRCVWSPVDSDETAVVEHPLMDLWSCSASAWPSAWLQRVVDEVYGCRAQAALDSRHGCAPLTYGLLIGSDAALRFFDWLLHGSRLLAGYRSGSACYAPDLVAASVTAIFASTAADETGRVDSHFDQSDVTVNLCLQTVDLAGGAVVFSHAGAVHSVEHRSRRMLVHSGALKHAVLPVVQGKRLNLVVWFTRKKDSAHCTSSSIKSSSKSS